MLKKILKRVLPAPARRTQAQYEELKRQYEELKELTQARYEEFNHKINTIMEAFGTSQADQIRRIEDLKNVTVHMTKDIQHFYEELKKITQGQSEEFNHKINTIMEAFGTSQADQIRRIEDLKNVTVHMTKDVQHFTEICQSALIEQRAGGGGIITWRNTSSGCERFFM